MLKSTTLTHFIKDLSMQVDRGMTVTIEDVHTHIQRKDLLEWLEQEFPFLEDGVDFSGFTQENRNYLHDELKSQWGGYAGDERRKWGIVNNGLCLLISWTTEILFREIDRRF